jgi:hypothetical protein
MERLQDYLQELPQHLDTLQLVVPNGIGNIQLWYSIDWILVQLNATGTITVTSNTASSFINIALCINTVINRYYSRYNWSNGN